MDERLRSFDPEMEKSLINEINVLFDFFDTNKDGTISLEELTSALKASNPFLTAAEIALIMKEVDVNKSDSLDRKEFQTVLLPQLKLEML